MDDSAVQFAFFSDRCSISFANLVCTNYSVTFEARYTPVKALILSFILKITCTRLEHNFNRRSTNFLVSLHTMSRTLIIDCQVAGISGDMLLSGLIDLGAEKKKVIEGIYLCGSHIDGCKINSVEFTNSKSNGISCTSFSFNYEEKHHCQIDNSIKQRKYNLFNNKSQCY